MAMDMANLDDGLCTCALFLRFEEMSNAAGVDVDARILDTMDWDNWTDGGDSSSGGDEEEGP